MAKKGKKGILKEFKEFAIQGNMFDMAIGVLIGAAFKEIVTSFTNNIIMPVISVFTTGMNFDEWYIELPQIFGKKLDEAGNVIPNYWYLGKFVSGLISFLITAFVIFLMVKAVNKIRARHKKEEEPAAPAEPTNEEKLLTEIRDLLKEK